MPQLDHVLRDLGGDPPHHLQPLRHRRYVPDGDQVLDLQRGQRARHLVEAQFVPLQRGECLIGPGQDRGRLLQDPPFPVHVQRDQTHRLGDRDDGEAARLGDPVRRAVPGARLLRVDRGVRDQLHAGPQDLGHVLVEDQRPVELAQLAQARRRELHVQHESAGAHRLDGLVHAQHDQATGIAAENPLQAVPQGHSGRDRAQRGAHQRLVTGALAGLSGRRRPVVGCHCTPPVTGCGALASPVPCPRAGETRAKSTGARCLPDEAAAPLDETGAGGPAGRRPCRRLP
ncbi:hypothetical protein SGRI78S_05497 [Streptomyces griseus subsp. griseus]